MDDGQRNLLTRVALWFGIAAFPLTLISIVLWFPWYWPRVSVKTSSDTVEPFAGMPLSFSIEDDGVLKAHSARYRCYFAHVQSAPQQPQITINDSYSDEVAVADVLLPNDPVEVACPGLGVPASEADVAILVSFRPSFDWRRSSACGRYILRKNAAGLLAWFRKSSVPCVELAACLNAREMANREYRSAMREYVKALREGHPKARPRIPSATSCLPKSSPAESKASFVTPAHVP
jgi:hypothetical protein